MSKSKIQEKFDAGLSINWFELVEWEKEVLEEKRQATEEQKTEYQTECCAENVDQMVKMELEEADAKGTENQSVPESSDPIPLKSLLEIGQYKLEAPSEELLEQDEITNDSKDQDHVGDSAVPEPEEPSTVADLTIVDSDSDDDDCILLEDTSNDFPKSMQETTGNSKPGTSLVINNNLTELEIEIPEPTTTVNQMGSETQENDLKEEAGAWNSKIVEEELIAGGIQEINWKDLPEKQLFFGSQESFIIDELEHVESSLNLSEPEADVGLDHAEEISIVPENRNSAETESAGSGNEPRASTSGLLDSLPGPSNSLNADERKLKTSQKRQKVQENDVVENRRNLKRKCKKSNRSESSSISQLKSDKNPNPPLNGKPKRNLRNQAYSKNQKIVNPMTNKRSRKASSGKIESLKANQKKFWECNQCGKKIGHKKRDLLRHLQTHFTTKNFNCSICGKAFKTANNKCRHEQLHTAPKVTCKICGKVSKNRFALSQHYGSVHSNRKKAECGICKKILSSKQSLREHEMRVHNLN
jgi:hypothetical protein